MGHPERASGQRESSVAVLDLIGLVILAAPLAIGAVHVQSQLVLAAVVALGAAYVWLRPAATLPRFRVVGWTALAWLAWSLLMLVPGVPGLSSGAAEAYETAASLSNIALQPSLTPDRPRSAAMLLTLLAYGLLAVTVWGRSLEGTQRGSAHARIRFYVIIAGGLSALVAAVHTAMGATVLYGLYTPVTSLATMNLRGPMVNDNHTAALMLLTACVTFGALGQSRDRNRTMVLAAVWAGIVVVCVMSASRANLALLVISHGYLLWRARIEDRQSMEGLGWMVTTAIGLATVAVMVFSGRGWGKSIGVLTQQSWALAIEQVLERWQVGGHVLLDRPWLGHGPGAFGVAAPLHTTSWFGGFLDRPHNLVLQLGTEWGLPIALVLLSVGGWWLCRLFMRTRSTPGDHAVAVGLIAVVLQNMVDFSLLIPGVGVAWVASAAWLTATVDRTTVVREPGGWRRPIVLLACIATLVPLGALAYEGDPRRTSQWVRSNASSESWRGAVNEAISAHPMDFHLHTLGSAIALAHGEVTFAHQMGQRAIALAPSSPTALEAAARAAFAANEDHAGRRALTKLCQRPVVAAETCLSMLIAQREHEGLVEDVVRGNVKLTLALAEHLGRHRHREAAAEVLAWAHDHFPEHLGVQEALVEIWLRLPDTAKELDAFSVKMLARSAHEENESRKRRLQRMAYLVQARFAERDGRDLEARHLYQEAARLGPERATEPLLHAARVLSRLGDMEHLDEVLDDLNRKLPRWDTNGWVRYHRLRSRACMRTGRLSEATGELHRAIRLSPRDPSLYEALAQSLMLQGDERGAARAREKAATLR